jgi:hypothetical protein
MNTIQPSCPNHTIRTDQIGAGHAVVRYDLKLAVVSQGEAKVSPACKFLGPFYRSLTVEGQHFGTRCRELVNIVSQLHELPPTRSSPMGS